MSAGSRTRLGSSRVPHVSDLWHDAHHEVNTPLAVLLGYLQVWPELDDDERGSRIQVLVEARTRLAAGLRRLDALLLDAVGGYGGALDDRSGL